MSTAAIPTHAAVTGHRTTTTDRRHEQLRRLLYPSLTKTTTTVQRNGENHTAIPFLLPLNQSQEADTVWVEVDLQFQLIQAQVLRIAILPWYSKLTNDKDLFEEVTTVVRYGLRQVKQALLSPASPSLSSSSSSSNDGAGLTRLERFLLLEVPKIVRLHYVEVRRAISRARESQDDRSNDGDEDDAAARIYLASNPHAAVKLREGQVCIDEAYIDVLLLAILQAVLPPDHVEAPTEVVIIMDVVKGLFRGQERVRGGGLWVVVRIMTSLLEQEEVLFPSSNTPSEVSDKEAEDGSSSGNSNGKSNSNDWWHHHRARLLLAVHFISAVLKALFLYLATFYLDLFSPTNTTNTAAEPTKKKSKRRKRDAETMPKEHFTDIQWNLLPWLETMVEILHWKQRILTRFIEEWLRLALAWGGSWLIERHVKESLLQNTEPNKLLRILDKVHSILLALPHQPPPEAVIEPPVQQQHQEFQDLVSMLLRLAQSKSAVALLLGRDEGMQRRCIEDALLPLSPPLSKSTSLSVMQAANMTTSIIMLERIALLLNAALEKR